MISCDDTGTLFCAFLDGEANDAQKEQVEGHLAGCADCRRESRRLAMLDRLYLEVLIEDRTGDETPAGLKALGRSRSGRRSRVRRRAPERTGSSPAVWAAVAAGFALVAALFFFAASSGRREPSRTPGIVDRPVPTRPQPTPAEKVKERAEPTPPPVPDVKRPPVPGRAPSESAPGTPLPPPSRTPDRPTPPPVPKPTPAPPAPPTVSAVAVVESVEGTVFLGAEKIAARPGLQILAGQPIHTAADSRVRITYPDGTKLSLEAGSVIGSFVERNGKQIELTKGTLSADVTPQPAGRPMVVTTPQARATVLGTVLTVSVVGTSTRLEVAKGRVRLTRASDNRFVTVRSGHFALAAQGVPLRARALPRTEILFADTFNSSPVDQWPRGWHKHATNAATRSGFRVRASAAAAAQRYMTCPVPGGGTTQHAYLPPLSWGKRFTVTFRMRVAGPGNTRAGIEFIDRDGSQHPDFRYEANRGTIAAYERRPVEKLLTSVPYRIAPVTWSTWRLAVDGQSYSLSIDDRPVLSIEMTRSAAIEAASLVSRGSDSAEFDDVSVTRTR